MLKVSITDCSPLVRGSLGRLLAMPDVQVTGYAEDAASTYRLIATTRPDVALLDVDTRAARRGIDLVSQVRRRWPSVRIVALLDGVTPDLRERLLQAGALACFDKALEPLRARDWIATLAGASTGFRSDPGDARNAGERRLG